MPKLKCVNTLLIPCKCRAIYRKLASACDIFVKLYKALGLTFPLSLIHISPNIIIGTSLGLSFFDFLGNTGVIAAVCLVFTVVYFFLCFRKHRKKYTTVNTRHTAAITPVLPRKSKKLSPREVPMMMLGEMCIRDSGKVNPSALYSFTKMSQAEASFL